MFSLPSTSRYFHRKCSKYLFINRWQLFTDFTGSYMMRKRARVKMAVALNRIRSESEPCPAVVVSVFLLNDVANDATAPVTRRLLPCQAHKVPAHLLYVRDSGHTGAIWKQCIVKTILSINPTTFDYTSTKDIIFHSDIIQWNLS